MYFLKSFSFFRYYESEKYAEDDGFEEHIKYRQKPRYDKRIENEEPSSGRFIDDEDKFYREDSAKQFKEPPVPKQRQKYAPDDPRFYNEDARRNDIRHR